jgi:hypothetical protein
MALVPGILPGTRGTKEHEGLLRDILVKFTLIVFHSQKNKRMPVALTHSY